jgi:hypothetical protein
MRCSCLAPSNSPAAHPGARIDSIDAATQATATFLAKADGTLAGVAVADMVFDMVDPTLKAAWSKHGTRHRAARLAGVGAVASAQGPKTQRDAGGARDRSPAISDTVDGA